MDSTGTEYTDLFGIGNLKGLYKINPALVNKKLKHLQMKSKGISYCGYYTKMNKKLFGKRKL